MQFYFSCDILHAKQKFKHLKNLKVADSDSNNENLCVDILIDSDFLWDVFENEIILGEPGTLTAVKTKFGLSGPMSIVQNNEGSTLICQSLKYATEISDCDSILQKNFKNFWKIKRFDSKTDNSTQI